MNDKTEEIITIPLVAHELAMERESRRKTFTIFTITALILALLLSNFLWLRYEIGYTTEETKIDQNVETGEGTTNVTGYGDITYGESETDNHD